MAIKETTYCRICGNTKFENILNLGKQPLSSVFPKENYPDPTVSPLELIMCSNESNKEACGLVQLKHQADLSEMYGTTYGYFSSISPLMVNHLKRKVNEIVKYVKPNKNDIVLDIGCNDGTLLNNYNKDLELRRIGIDPSSEKFKNNFEKKIEIIYDFFSESKVREIIGKEKCKIITSIAMFYDIDNPLHFMKEIESLLSIDGVWILELSYLPLLCTQLTYDQVCHEHVTYLSLNHIDLMVKKTGLKILEVSFNDLNGGSFSIYVGKENGPYIQNEQMISKILESEKPLNDPKTYEKFKNRVINHKEEIKNFFMLTKKAGLKVYGYGASTKGNIVMNYCGLSKDEIIAIGDRNPEKNGLTTPGTRIPIISHEELREKNADYIIVFIWHLRKEVIQDEMDYIINGGKLVFILPRLHIIDSENYLRYINDDFKNLAYSI